MERWCFWERRRKNSLSFEFAAQTRETSFDRQRKRNTNPAIWLLRVVTCFGTFTCYYGRLRERGTLCYGRLVLRTQRETNLTFAAQKWRDLFKPFLSESISSFFDRAEVFSVMCITAYVLRTQLLGDAERTQNQMLRTRMKKVKQFSFAAQKRTLFFRKQKKRNSNARVGGWHVFTSPC